MVEKFNILRTYLRDPILVTPDFVILYSNFLLYFPILKITCVKPKWIKTIILAVLFEENFSNVVPQSFVKFYLFYTFVSPENFMCLT